MNLLGNAGEMTRNDQAIQYLILIATLVSVCVQKVTSESPPNALGNALPGKQTCSLRPSKVKAPA